MLTHGFAIYDTASACRTEDSHVFATRHTEAKPVANQAARFLKYALRSMIHAQARDHMKQIGINYRDPQSYTQVPLGRMPCRKLFY
jgi:hypothetical protein